MSALNQQQPPARLRMDNLTCLMRFLYLGQRDSYHICSGRETTLEAIVDNLECIHGMVRPKMESYPFQVIKRVMNKQ